MVDLRESGNTNAPRAVDGTAVRTLRVREESQLRTGAGAWLTLPGVGCFGDPPALGGSATSAGADTTVNTTDDAGSGPPATSADSETRGTALTTEAGGSATTASDGATAATTTGQQTSEAPGSSGSDSSGVTSVSNTVTTEDPPTTTDGNLVCGFDGCPVDPVSRCSCFGCVDDDVCDVYEDCVCPDCQVCGCQDDGSCDVYGEDCSCIDCLEHPECAAG